MLANTSALLHVQPSLCLHETKKLPSLKPTQEKNAQPNTLLTHAITHIGNQKFQHPPGLPKRKKIWVVECMLQIVFG